MDKPEFYFTYFSFNYVIPRDIQFQSRDEKGILKPEEIGRAIISDPIGFDFCESESEWERFGAKLKWLVTQQAQESVSLGLTTYVKSDNDEFRVIICIPDPPEESKMDKVSVYQKMKLKLVSNISLKASRQEREHGCLVQLARLCAPQNVNIEIKRMGSGTKFPRMKQPCVLSWNEEDLSWEAEVELVFGREAMIEFKNGTYSRYSPVKAIFFKLEDDGVRRWSWSQLEVAETDAGGGHLLRFGG